MFVSHGDGDVDVDVDVDAGPDVEYAHHHHPTRPTTSRLFAGRGNRLRKHKKGM